MRSLLRALVAGSIASIVFLAFPPAGAQVRPVYDRGAAGLTQVLERLQTTASALHTGAHPDDEDSAFMARTARGDHARVAYLSLTRGEGGQNFIGTELFDALGVIRTEELLQARTLDGGAQFFTRAIDFGFSKTRAEAAARWGEREVLDDMVRIIRMFRPLVIVSRFSGTAADGHGHHQLAGYVTPLAFRAAADPQAFTAHFDEGLRPWQAKKLYRSVRQPSEPGLLELVTGRFDQVIGRTYAEIAAEGRSQHKSQEMGVIEPRGEVRSYVRLIEVAARPAAVQPGSAEQGIFDGLDTSIAGIPALAGLPAGALQTELRLVADLAQKALDDYEPLRAERIVPTLAAGLRATRAVRAALPAVAAPPPARAEADFLLSFKEEDFSEALLRASAVVIDALADRETVPHGSTVNVSVRAFFPEGSAVRVIGSRLTAAPGWTIGRRGEGALSAGQERPAYSQEFVATPTAGARLTQPYFLAVPRDGDLYQWGADALKGLPFEKGPLTASVELEIGGVAVTATKRVDYRFADRVRGEIRRNVNVVPALTVSVDSPLLIVPLGATPHVQQITTTTTSHGVQEPASASVRLQVPPGWTTAPPQAAVSFGGTGDRTSTPFVLTAPADRTAGRMTIGIEAASEDSTYSREMQTISYPHIETHRVYRPSAITAQVFALEVAPVRVGYVMGTGDQVPDALRRMGVSVTMLETETLASGDLSVYDTIVVGVRASEARPEFAAEHGRLMDYVRRGGTLIVQYQQSDYAASNLPPFPAAPPQGATNSRVTDETAPVRILAPDHPVFTFPNRITAADFEGWVQERNLYAFPLVDPRYTSLLETADPGEPPQRGGQVVAEIGDGRYVYTAYAWFRQLPAGVPGAYRQMANLISLSKAPR